jgi:hypothetical protein
MERGGVTEMGRPVAAMQSMVGVPEATQSDISTRDILGAGGEILADIAVSKGMGSAAKLFGKTLRGAANVSKKFLQNPLEAEMGQMQEAIKRLRKTPVAPEKEALKAAEIEALETRKSALAQDELGRLKLMGDEKGSLRERLMELRRGVQAATTPEKLDAATKFAEAPVTTALTQAGKGLYRKGIKPLIEAAEKSHPGFSDIDELLYSLGVAGTAKTQAKKIEKLADKFGHAADGLEAYAGQRGGTVDMAEALRGAQKELATLAKRGEDPGAVNKAHEIVDRVRALGVQPLSEAVEVKKLWQQRARPAYGQGGLDAPGVAQIRKAGARGMKEGIEEATAKIHPKLGADLKRFNEMQSRLLGVQDAARARVGGIPLPSAGQLGAAAGVGALGSRRGALATLALSGLGKTVGSPFALTRGGQALRLAGKVPEPLARYGLYSAGRAAQPSPWSLLPEEEK